MMKGGGSEFNFRISAQWHFVSKLWPTISTYIFCINKRANSSFSFTWSQTKLTNQRSAKKFSVTRIKKLFYMLFRSLNEWKKTLVKSHVTNHVTNVCFDFNVTWSKWAIWWHLELFLIFGPKLFPECSPICRTLISTKL